MSISTLSMPASLVPLIAFALAAAVTPLVRRIARRFGAVAQPKSDRWHSKPTAMMGGIAIFVAVMATLLIFVPQTPESWIVIGCSSALFMVGLIDDFLHVKPYQKLIGQLLAASVVVYLGLVLPWTGSFVVNMIITFVWLIGITNAVNMLDNMDGLAAGVSAIAAAFLAVTFLANGQPGEAMMLGAFCGGLLGFLIYNHNPASIFMGDCGSMFIGFFLASTALLASHAGGGRSRSVIAVLAVPVLVLCIPIFDTTFVTVMRKLAGRAASQGGRDHTSHRLVALGLSERQAVWMLYAFAILAGLLGLGVRRFQLDVSIASIAGFSIALALLGVYLAGVRVYSPEEVEASRQRPFVALLFDLSFKRRIFEVVLDLLLIVLSHYAAYAILFGPARKSSGDWQLFLLTLPAIVFVKMATFLATGVYRAMWKYAGIADVMTYVRAVILSSALSVLMVVYAFRFEGFSRTAFFLDGVILLMTMTVSRFAFRLLRGALPAPHARTARRVLIFGAGDGGELALRELMNNSGLQCIPVGFIDDDPHKTGKFLHGLRIYSGTSSIARLCHEKQVEDIFLSTTLTDRRLETLVEECTVAGVHLKRMRIVVESLNDTDAVWVTHPPGVLEVPLPKAPRLHLRPGEAPTLKSDH